jgi:hypothetical protein
MDILNQLGVALGLATLAGVNLYLTVLLTGLAIRFNLLNLATQYEQLGVLGDPVVLIVAGVLFVLEFFADKIPWVDSMWDTFHTFVRPIGGVVLGLTALGEMPVWVEVAAALVAGGAALTTHGAKAGTRLLVNHSPEPVTNTTLSVTEDVAVVGGTALALLHPVIGLFVFAAVLLVIWMVFPRLWRGIRATTWLVWHKLGTIAPPVDLRPTVSEDLRNLLKSQAGLEESDIVTTVRCLSGRSRGVRGLSPNLRGTLILTKSHECAWFAASKGLSDRVFRIALPSARAFAESRFLSENLLVETHGSRVVFRFPRGQDAVVQTLVKCLHERLEAARTGAPAALSQPAWVGAAEPQSGRAPAMVPAAG